MSLSSWRAWIEIDSDDDSDYWDYRSPHGERGLKSRSTPTPRAAGRRSPHGERGLKFVGGCFAALTVGRSPHGERGLK